MILIDERNSHQNALFDAFLTYHDSSERNVTFVFFSNEQPSVLTSRFRNWSKTVRLYVLTVLQASDSESSTSVVEHRQRLIWGPVTKSNGPNVVYCQFLLKDLDQVKEQPYWEYTRDLPNQSLWHSWYPGNSHMNG